MSKEYLVDWGSGDVNATDSNPFERDMLEIERKLRFVEEDIALDDEYLLEDDYEPADFSGVSGDR